MAKQRHRASVLLNWIRVERRAAAPLYRQVADQIRGAILAGGISPGELLPASRALALDLGVSRITTLQAYDQLIAEGFLETRRGSGTRVAIALAKKPLARPAASGKSFKPRHVQELFPHEPTSVEFQPAIPPSICFRGSAGRGCCSGTGRGTIRPFSTTPMSEATARSDRNSRNTSTVREGLRVSPSR